MGERNTILEGVKVTFGCLGVVLFYGALAGLAYVVFHFIAKYW